MARVPLVTGAYRSRSIISSAQRSVNLYAEMNPKDSPVPYTYLVSPGLRLLYDGDGTSTVRQVYRASNGAGYAVIGDEVFSISPSFALTSLGNINPGTNTVGMADNGLAIVIVDGTGDGWAIEMSSNTFGQISSTNFYGADTVTYLDTYLVFNRPETNQMYISLSNVTYSMLVGGTAFDPLDIAAKAGYPDYLQAVIMMHKELWLVGEVTTEVWYNSGAADFTFQPLPGAFIQHGTIAPYSVATQHLSVYFLGQDQQGRAVVFQGANYQALRISTHAIENEFATYSDISDAIGFCYQLEGHVFYVLTFPTANKTWEYDTSTEQWGERAWTDANGNLNRHRANCVANIYNTIVVGDWSNGNLYAWDINTYTDNGDPITRLRGFPHLLNDGNRMMYSSFIADMQVGTDSSSTPANPPEVSLRWSDTRGASWGNHLQQSIGAGGEYLTSPQWARLGMARDRVFELMWSAPTLTALNGAFVDAIPVGT